MRIIYIGHSTVLVELDGVRVLTDPILVDRVGPLLRHGPSPDLHIVSRVDIVLLSHLHADHFNLTSLRLVDPQATLIAPRGSGAYLRERTGRTVVEIGPGELYEFGSIVVRATDARHDPRGQPLGIQAPTLGYVIDGEQSIYFAGDTDIFPGMAAIPDDADGQIDLALLPVSGWGLRVPKGHLNPQRAAEALNLIQPVHAVPIHWGSLRLAGTHTIHRRLAREPATEFAALAHDLAPQVNVRIVRPGGSTTFQESSQDNRTAAAEAESS